MGFNLDVVITDNRGDGVGIVHNIHLSHYTEVLSYNAFPGQKAVHPKFCAKSKHDWLFDREICGRTDARLGMNLVGEFFDNAPTHHHTNLWDFYHFIGWDWKKKRWTTPQEADVSSTEVSEEKKQVASLGESDGDTPSG